ncbi:hypothetical protein QJS04_geneDACA007062 [Acorus gramineus]|uniref:Uncharacterized protein n=1 Tax=Acorus gramineus TaxID=55184 RepID=A0AAV9BNB5_ACOGR|nr:hypothetical protein QJS04_geneDACA007062 [Acorus gramineus]
MHREKAVTGREEMLRGLTVDPVTRLAAEVSDESTTMGGCWYGGDNQGGGGG